MDGRCRIELLGWLRVHQGDRMITRFQTRKAGALLAYLAFHLHRSHPRDQLVEVHWPEEARSSDRHKLRKALSSLRRQIEPAGVPPGSVIVADRNTVQFNPAVVTTDVAEFEAALQAALETRSDSEQIRRLIEAVEMYPGELLPGYCEDWIVRERQQLAESYALALRRLVGLLEAGGEVERAIHYARRAVSADPLREEAHHDLMRLLAAAGQPAAALRQYRQLERLLESELGLMPEGTGEHLTEWADSVRRSLLLCHALERRSGIAMCLRGLGVVAAAAGRPECAARLFGAGLAVLELAGQELFCPPGHAMRERGQATQPAAQLQQTHAAAWMEGRAMEMDEAVAYALES